MSEPAWILSDGIDRQAHPVPEERDEEVWRNLTVLIQGHAMAGQARNASRRQANVISHHRDVVPAETRKAQRSIAKQETGAAPERPSAR